MNEWERRRGKGLTPRGAPYYLEQADLVPPCHRRTGHEQTCNFGGSFDPGRDLCHRACCESASQFDPFPASVFDPRAGLYSDPSQVVIPSMTGSRRHADHVDKQGQIATPIHRLILRSTIATLLFRFPPRGASGKGQTIFRGFRWRLLPHSRRGPEDHVCALVLCCSWGPWPDLENRSERGYRV